MPTECSPDRMEFARVEGRAVVAGFDGGTITSDAGALLLGATDRAIGLVRRFAACFADHRAPDQIEHERRHPGRPARVRPGAGLRGPDRSRSPAPRPGAGGGHRQAQPHAAPTARRWPASRRSTGSSTRRPGSPRATIRSAMTGARSSGCSSSCSSTRTHPARGDRARPGRDRRPAARPPGGPLLPRLLRLLLLPAALRLLRRPPAGRQAAAVEHRRQRRRGRGDCADRGADPRPLAAGADRPARRQRLRPRGADGLVRGQPGRLRLRPGPQRAPGRARSPPSWTWPEPRPKRPASRPAASGTSATRRSTAGAGSGASSARPSSWSPVAASRAPTRASS